MMNIVILIAIINVPFRIIVTGAAPTAPPPRRGGARVRR